MKSGYLGTMAMLFLGAGWAAAQVPAPATTPAPLPSGVVMPSSVGMSGDAGTAPVIPCDAGVGGGGPVWYVSADYLLWKVQNGKLPSAATFTPFGVIPVTGTNTETINGVPVPTVPGTTAVLPVLIQSNASFGGGGNTNTGYQNGGRFSTGFWADPNMSVGVEAVFMFLSNGTDHFAAINGQGPSSFTTSTGVNNTFLALTQTPGIFGTTTTTAQITTPIILAGQANSSVSGHTENSLYSGELNVRGVCLRIGGTDLGCLGGFRFLTFRDSLFVNNNVSISGLNINSTPPTTLPSMTFSSVDNTRVTNNFYGGQVGMDLDSKFGSYFIYARGQVAFGNNHQIADVASTSTTTMNGVTTNSAGGLLAGPGDNGRHTRDVLSIIPQVDVKLGYQFTDWLRGSIGYGGIYLNNFGRAGETASTSTLNTNATIGNSQTPVNVVQPTFRFQDRSFYVQGVTFGLEAKF